MRESLKIILWNEEVGRLFWDNRKKRSYFEFSPLFLKRGLDIAPIVAPIGEFKSMMPIYAESGPLYQKLPAFLADSLPDSWGNQLFECWLKENKIPPNSITPLDKLSFIGKRGMGAFEFGPSSSKSLKKEKLNIESLANLAQKIYSQREQVHILPDESITLQSLVTLGTSAGGRQPKAILAINLETFDIRSGGVNNIEGYDYYIIKFGDNERFTSEIEMTYYEMAIKAGISMMDSRLFEVEGKKHFLTKRFDRIKKEKLHTQTLAALNPEADSYEKLLSTCRKMSLSEKDSEEVFRRMVFNILSNNTDDHNKNFSFIMDKDGTWRLAPAYDMTFILDRGGFLGEKQRCLMIAGKLHEICKDDVYELAQENGIRKVDSIIEKVVKAISSFKEIAEKNGVSTEWIQRINLCLNSHLKDWGFYRSQNLQREFNLNGHLISSVEIEQAYKGNLILKAIIDKRQRKFVIRRGTQDFEKILSKGFAEPTDDILIDMINNYFLSLN